MLKENRSLDRGLQVLEVLAANPAMSLTRIHRETGLPLSTLRRLLATLVARRFVRRSLSDRLYRSLVNLPDISREPIHPGLAMIADVGLTHALDLTRRIGWPSDIHLIEDHWMRVVESTRPASPYSLYQVRIDLRVNLFATATGSICLSQMDMAHVRALYDDPTPALQYRPDRYNMSWQNVVDHLDKVRRQGYGERIQNFRGEITPNDKLFVIALPLRKNGRLCGAISLLWPKVLMQPDAFAALYLDDLAETVTRINAQLDAQDSGKRPARPDHNPS